MALNSLLCADVPLSNYSLTHPPPTRFCFIDCCRLYCTDVIYSVFVLCTVHTVNWRKVMTTVTMMCCC